MKDFPQESIDHARWIVDKYRRRSRSKLKIATQIYDNKFIHIGYGFGEAIKKGNCGLFLHEIDKECNCFTYLGAVYLVAREANLNPKMYWGIGIKDVGEGEDPSEKSSFDHGFITVEVGKGKTLVLDWQTILYGYAKFNRENNIIEVYDKGSKKITFRQYQHLSELSEKEYLERLEENRSPNGGRIVLSTTQRIVGAGNKDIYLHYNPENHELKSSIRFPTIKFGPDPYHNILIIDLKTSVNEDGTYDFRQGDLSFYYASMSGWSEHENPQIPITIPVEDAAKCWEIWDNLMSEIGRKAPCKNALKLIEIIKEAGFNDDFTIKPRSKASKAIRINCLENTLEELQKAQKRTLNSYVREVSRDRLSYKSLLRYAQYIKAHDRAESKKNPKGFVFSEAEHLALLEKEFENYKEVTWRFFNTVIEQIRVRIGLEKGSLYKIDRDYNRSYALEIRNT